MQKSVLLFLIFSTNFSFAQNPYENLEYDSLVIYDFNWRGPIGKYRSILDANGELPPTVKRQATLTEEKANELSARIGEKRSYGQITAACFDPHFGMIYYEHGKPKEFITICLACNFPRSSLNIPARDQGPEEDNGEVYYTKTGFSKSFRKYLSELKQEYGFSSWKLDSQMFDQ